MTKRKAAAQLEAGRADSVACVDLFCGAGGLTHGMSLAGLPVVAGVDFDPACRHPYEFNNAGAKFHSKDVAELSGAELQRWFGPATTRVLAGCAPCQPFSSYSNRYDTVGTQRWGLLKHFARLIRESQPHVVTMENVPTVTKHSVFDEFVAALQDQDYCVWYRVVDGADYGLPQRRRRTVLLASKFGEIGLPNAEPSSRTTVRDALGDLPKLTHGRRHTTDPLHAASRLSPLNVKRIKASKPGGTWRDWPEELVAACHRRNTGKSYPGVYGRMRWDEPAPTLTTQFYGFGSGRFGHPSQARGLSIREGALLQGFPRTYSFAPEGQAVSLKVLGRLIGNAVPVTLGRVIGAAIVEHLASRGRDIGRRTAERGHSLGK